MKYDPNNHELGECYRWCKIHWYWNFEFDCHAQYPQERFFEVGYPINGRRQWSPTFLVHCGPPAYFPKRAT
jgi:hypothetical protein